MDIACTGTHDRGDDLCERAGGFDGRLGARLKNGSCDGARMPFLAQGEDYVGEIAFTPCVDQIGSTGALAFHAHIERPIKAERESAPRSVELHGRDAEVEDHTVYCLVSGIARDR